MTNMIIAAFVCSAIMLYDRYSTIKKREAEIEEARAEGYEVIFTREL